MDVGLGRQYGYENDSDLIICTKIANGLHTGAGMTAIKYAWENMVMRLAIQQEHNGENTNSVPEENENDDNESVNDVQDNQRDWDEESNGERRVRPQWGVPP